MVWWGILHSSPAVKVYSGSPSLIKGPGGTPALHCAIRAAFNHLLIDSHFSPNKLSEHKSSLPIKQSKGHLFHPIRGWGCPMTF